MSSRTAALLLLLLAFGGCRRDINHNPVRIAVTSIVSVDSSGVAGNLESSQPAVTPDGRYVAFISASVNLTGVPTNGKSQVYRRDRVTGNTIIVSVNDAGDAADSHCNAPSISADGTKIVFHSEAGNLVSDDTNFLSDIFLRDTALSQTTRVSVDNSSVEVNGESFNPVISADGKFVAFDSDAGGLVSFPTTGRHVFRRDLTTGKNRLVAITSGGGEEGGTSHSPSISADGRYVAFVSTADDLTGPPAVSGSEQVYRRDMTLTVNAIVPISVSTDPVNVAPDNASTSPSISADGLVVAFVSLATNLVPDDFTSFADVFVRNLRDPLNPTTTLVTRNSSGNQADQESTGPVLSGDGRFVAYVSGANNLAPGVSGFVTQIYWHDLMSGSTQIVSVATGREIGNAESGVVSGRPPAVSYDGRFVSFDSRAFNLIPFDVNGVADVFVRGPLY
jgi:Tol biopolymer transport system component